MKRPQSFEDAKRRRSRVLRIAKYFLFVFLAFEIFTSFALKAWIVGSTSMRPTLEPGDRLIVASSAYGFLNPFSGRRHALRSPERGDVILLRLPSAPRRAWYERFSDSLLRFVTLQRLGSPQAKPDDSPVVKRVIACPGDAVRMEGFVMQVKAAGTEHFLTEYEVSGGDYTIAGARPVEGWVPGLPLAGSMPEVTLGPDEYFVVGDDRFLNADSRLYGPIRSELIVGKVLARYWPFDRMSGL